MKNGVLRLTAMFAMFKFFGSRKKVVGHVGQMGHSGRLGQLGHPGQLNFVSSIADHASFMMLETRINWIYAVSSRNDFQFWAKKRKIMDSVYRNFVFGEKK